MPTLWSSFGTTAPTWCLCVVRDSHSTQSTFGWSSWIPRDLVSLLRRERACVKTPPHDPSNRQHSHTFTCTSRSRSLERNGIVCSFPFTSFRLYLSENVRPHRCSRSCQRWSFLFGFVSIFGLRWTTTIDLSLLKCCDFDQDFV